MELRTERAGSDTGLCKETWRWCFVDCADLAGAAPFRACSATAAQLTTTPNTQPAPCAAAQMSIVDLQSVARSTARCVDGAARLGNSLRIQASGPCPSPSGATVVEWRADGHVERCKTGAHKRPSRVLARLRRGLEL